MAIKLNILIVGDELGLGEELMKAVVGAGHSAQHVFRHDEAMILIPETKFDFILTDCMLPGTVNGVEFTVQARQQFPHSKSKFILMSGVFTDKDFIKDALLRSKAITFIEKKVPFNPSGLLALLKTEGGDADVVTARKVLYQIFSQEKVSSRAKRKLIETLEEVSGFDLPFVYSLLVETGSSGYLNIYEKNGGVSGVSFAEGSITTVDVEDRTTYLGEMLIQSGYVRPEHVQTALAERTNQRIGSRLISQNQLSPHAFDLILTEQMNLRLSRTVADQTFRINYVATDVEKTQPRIDSDLLLTYLHDWIASKLTIAWLKPLYMSWSTNLIRPLANLNDEHPSTQMGLIKALPGLVKHLREGVTLNRLMEEKDYTEVAVYKGLHFLLTRGLIGFGPKEAFRNDREQQAALRKIWNEIQKKNPFEIADYVGLENLRGEGLLSLIGSEPKAGDSRTMTLWKELNAKLAEASRVGSDTGARAKFREDAAGREAEARLRAGGQLEEAKQKLGLNQFALALNLLQSVQASHPHMEGLNLLLAWAKIGTIDNAKRATQLRDIEFDLVQVSAEERYDAHYPFVLGLFSRAKGDVMGAKKHFEKTIALKPSMIAARRELSAIDAQLKKEKDIFRSVDLKGMVAGLFKKR